MIIKSFSIPSASCVHSLVRPMTADEIWLMNEQLAARRAALVAQVRSMDPASVHEIAVNVARYNVAHVSEKNKAWAERRLQEELSKGGE
jgi:hypothetical protein